MAKCLYCYEELLGGESTLHIKCSRRVFSTSTAPRLPYSSNEISARNSTQLSLNKGAESQGDSTLIIEGEGDYILNTNNAELEAVTMLMADSARIPVTPHTLIYSTDGVAYHLTRTVNYKKKKSEQIEVIRLSTLPDICDNSSYEAVAEVIKKESTTPKLDVINLYERLLFAYIVGATHLDIESFVMKKSESGCYLAPAEQITPLTIISSQSDMAMSLNDKRNNLALSDFESAMLREGVEPKIIENLFTKFERSIDKWCNIIDKSPLPNQIKESYKLQIIIRFDTL